MILQDFFRLANNIGPFLSGLVFYYFPYGSLNPTDTISGLLDDRIPADDIVGGSVIVIQIEPLDSLIGPSVLE